MITNYVQVALEVPLFKLFEYSWDRNELSKSPEIGQIVEVEFGKKRVAAIIIEISNEPQDKKEKTYITKQVISIAPCPKIENKELKLYQFASKYYLRPIGEVIFSTIPSDWKNPSKWEKIIKSLEKKDKRKNLEENKFQESLNVIFNEEQKHCLDSLISDYEKNKFEISLLNGITGSGKTVVYLEWIKTITEDKKNQCLILVPEINLTPQLESTIRKYCQDREIIILHSNLTSTERNYAWLNLQLGKGQIIVGTRLGVFTPIKNLKVIVIDEENDNSYKQQDGMRYSARDIAIQRAYDLKIPVLLCSATPSTETWLKVLEKKIKLLELTKRAKFGSTIPKVVLVDIKEEKKDKTYKETGITKTVINQIRLTQDRKKQTLIFINRRGFAPVMLCNACNWKSSCKKCSAWLVLHKKIGKINKPMLHCHHCGLVSLPPDNCPECGNQDLDTLGTGTQNIEETIEKIFEDLRVLRIDTDSTRKKGQAEELFQKIHNGEADIVIGTQMLSKGHDFKNVETVIVLDIDKSLYSQDFRAIEKMFAQLVQVTGRSGRGENLEESKILIQTEFKDHEIFEAIQKTKFDEFYEKILEERKLVKLPPYSHQALIICESKKQELNQNALLDLKKYLMLHKTVYSSCVVYDPVTRGISRVAGIERTQILIESLDRKELQICLEKSLDYCEQLKSKNRSMKIIIERDPITF